MSTEAQPLSATAIATLNAYLPGSLSADQAKAVFAAARRMGQVVWTEATAAQIALDEAVNEFKQSPIV